MTFKNQYASNDYAYVLQKACQYTIYWALLANLPINKHTS